MAVPRKLVAVPNAATRELWRITESGAIDQFYDVLPHADINARNEHGMTALMRAAYHGRVQMVRVLLDHGADPNVTRNDNFTALSLAAFFGHAEIVEILVGHGANTEVRTRFGTSPYLWAKARSFGDVARRLENRGDDRKRSVPEEPVVERPAPPSESEIPPEYESSDSPIAVRTLKDPPEIWDLVQEAPRNFDARSAFMARVGSLNGALVLAVLLMVVIGGGAAAVFYFQDKVNSSTVPAPPTATAGTTLRAPATNQPPATNNTVSGAQPVVETESAQAEVNTTAPRRTRSFARSRANSNDQEPETIEPVTTPRPAVVPLKTDSGIAADADTKKSSPPANSQTISPPKSSQPKAKVIQWP